MSFLLNLFYITIVYLFLFIQSMYTKDAQDNRITIITCMLYTTIDTQPSQNNNTTSVETQEVYVSI